MTVHARQEHEIAKGATRTVSVSFAGKLESGEVLTGTPSVTAVSGSATVGSIARNSAAITVNGVSVATNKAVVFSVSALTQPRVTLRVACGTDGSPSQTLVMLVTFNRVDDGT